MKKIILLFTIALIFASCQSAPKDIPEDTSAKELIQLGQTSFDNGNKKAALIYYQTLIERYGTDASYYIEGKYEIAHIYVKQKRYKDAKPLLEEIINIYKDTPPGALPGSFGKLAQIEYEKIK